MSGLPSWIPLIGEKKNFLKAIIVYPNKNVRMIKIEGDKPTFKVGAESEKREYAVDPKAIYFFNKEPLLFYHSNNASPVMINDLAVAEESMNSVEFRSIIESKAVNDLLTAAGGGGMDWQFIASIVSAVGVVFLIVQGGGLGFLAGGG